MVKGVVVIPECHESINGGCLWNDGLNLVHWAITPGEVGFVFNYSKGRIIIVSETKMFLYEFVYTIKQWIQNVIKNEAKL